MSTWSLLSFQDSASPSMEQLIFFHDFTMTIITLITVLVGFNIYTICVTKYTNRYLLQEQTIEIIWTLGPIFILFSIALPSLQALYLLDDPLMPNMTIKAIGHQWYWSYEYSDFNTPSFDSYLTPLDNNTSMNRLLETDNSVALPTNSMIRLLTTSSDVIHAWTMPSLGMKADAIPGRLNQLMFLINRTGIFYGQCSEICGANHSFMPIKIEAVPMKLFINWMSKTM
uniref:cytochrome c oxidase subunit 2 n=1 Tax=Charcotia amundseni TaxID=2259499 RepID=UPI001FF317A1|nr:cytochrome c oxidase subunit 2 [Charcotia amundseni]UIN24680.1 cytochrome c oxidase subunit 2 [Charcotia amundseni]